MHKLNVRSGHLKLVSTILQTYVREINLNKTAEPHILVKCIRCGNQRVSTHRVVLNVTAYTHSFHPAIAPARALDNSMGLYLCTEMQ